MNKIDSKQVFFSYSRLDHSIVKSLYDKLMKCGFRPWMDTENIFSGENWERAIYKAIKESAFFIAFISNNSVNRRGLIQKEIKEALEIWERKLDYDIYLIPIKIDDCEFPDSLANFQWLNYNDEDGFHKLLNSLKEGLSRLGIIDSLYLRSSARVMEEAEVITIIKAFDFFDRQHNNKGAGIANHYEKVVGKNSTDLIVDHKTNLMWQQSGSIERFDFNKLHYQIRQLNLYGYGGFDDWRIPTIEEAMSLMESKLYGELFIDSVFDETQKYIWTSDREKQNFSWNVSYNDGSCISSHNGYECFIRAVRNVTK